MRKDEVYARMLRDLVHEFGEPDFIWQAVALAVALAVAFLLARWLRGRLRIHYERVSPARRAGASSLLNALFPMLGWAVVGVARLAIAPSYHISLLKVAQVPLFGIGIIYIAFYLARRLFDRSEAAKGLLRVVERVVVTLAWVSMAVYVLGLQHDIDTWLRGVNIPLGRAGHLTLYTLLSGAVWVCMTVVAALWLGTLLDDRIMRASSLDANLRVVLARTTKAVLLLVAILMSLTFVGIDITVLGVFGGALGVGLGFGLQKIASNYVSGFIILLDRSLRIGDLVTVNTYHGVVSQIKTRYTVVRGLDGVEALVPNEQIISNVVQNHSFTVTRGRAKVAVQVAYSADVELAMQLMLDAAKDIARVIQEPPPSTALVNFAADGMDLEMGFWVDDPSQGTQGIKSEINLKIWRSFREHGIEIPYPQREVRILNDWMPDGTGLSGQSGRPGRQSGETI